MIRILTPVGTENTIRELKAGISPVGIYGARQTFIDDGVSKRLTLNKGPNIMRAAIVNGGGATDFCARFLDAEGKLLKEITASLRAPGSAPSNP